MCILSLEIVHILCYTVYDGKGVIKMPIVYNKMMKLLADNGYTSYRIRKEKILGQATMTAVKNGTGGLDHRSIARLCHVLHCQPGDLMEYVEETEETGE